MPKKTDILTSVIKKNSSAVSGNREGLFFITDANGKILAVSNALLRFIGKPKKQLIGASIKEIISTSDFKRISASTIHEKISFSNFTVRINGKNKSSKILFTIKQKKASANGVDLFEWKAMEKKTPAPNPPGIKRKSALTLSENIFGRSPEIMCIIDLEKKFVKTNKEFEQAFNYNNATLTSNPFLNIVFREDHKETIKILEEVIHTGKIYDFENRCYRHNGTLIWLSWSLVFLKDEKLILLTGRDISRNKNSIVEKRIDPNREPGSDISLLHESEVRFNQIADMTAVMIWVSDQKDRTIFINKTLEDFTGKAMHEINWNDIIHPEDISVAIDEYNEAFKKRLPTIVEYRLKTRHGDYRWVLDHGTPRFLPDGSFLGYIGSLMDINDRKIAEEKNLYQARMLENIKDVIVSTDLEFRILAWNKSAEIVYGLKTEDVIGHPIRNFVDHKYILDSREKALEELYKNDCWEGEVYFDRHKDGKRIYFLMSLSFVKNDKGERIGLVGVHTDITYRYEAERILRINEERYRSLVNALTEGIVMQDAQENIIACNKSAEKIFGLSKTELIGLKFKDQNWERIHKDGSPFLVEELPSVYTFKTGLPTQNVIMGLRKPDNSFGWLSVNTTPIFYTEQKNKPDAVVASFIDITEKVNAENELLNRKNQLKEYSERITDILDSITDGFIAVDKDLNILLWNSVFENVTGINEEAVIGKNVIEVLPALHDKNLSSKYVEALSKKETIVTEQYYYDFKIWFEISIYPSSRGLFIYFRNINERKIQDQLLELDKEVLKLNAKATAPLKLIVDYFLQGLEKIFSGNICSVLTLDEDRISMRHLSAPSLPKAFSEAIKGAKIGPRVGSCGTAMYKKQTIITHDIDTDPLWEGYRPLAHAYGLRSCWSIPILNVDNEVLATIAIYHKIPKSPSANELNVYEKVASLLRIIIENKRSEELIKNSNERYLLATKATNDAIWDWDAVTGNLYRSEGFYNLFGYKVSDNVNNSEFWIERLHADDKRRVTANLEQFIAKKSFKVWEAEYLFRKADGSYAMVHDRGFLIFNNEGEVKRMIGSMQDVTETKELQKKLILQELQKQKVVAQAIVDAQEKERLEIGKELHDNVNQILSTARLYLELAKSDENERIEMIDRSTENIRDAINEIRFISRSLVPPSIGDIGLVETIKELVDSVQATKKLQVQFYSEGNIDAVTPDKQKLMLYRIVQEQVSNVLKHANARNIVIELMLEEEFIDLSISDDGKGFEYGKNGKKGVGLTNIASRTELFNGKLNIVTSPGKGCKLNIHVPIYKL